MIRLHRARALLLKAELFILTWKYAPPANRLSGRICILIMNDSLRSFNFRSNFRSSMATDPIDTCQQLQYVIELFNRFLFTVAGILFKF